MIQNQRKKPFSLFQLLKQLPVQLVLCLVLALTFESYISFDAVRTIYTASCFIKDVLIAVLPFIIFAYIFDAMIGLDKRAPFLILTILVMVFLSNMTAVMTAYGMGKLFLPLMTQFSSSTNEVHQLVEPFFSIHLPQLIAPDMAMMSGIIAGLCAGFFKIEIAKPFGHVIHKAVTWFLQKTFIPVLPIYVTGFVLKLNHEGSLQTLIHNYLQVFVLAISLIALYLCILYFVGSGFRMKSFSSNLKNMLPAGITGFSTMSSAATMPVTLESCEKNLKDPRFADLIVPSTVNIHLLGDALAIPLTGLALLWFKTGTSPDFLTYAFFAVMFSLTKYSCAAVPGGGVIVILPVLHKYLGLDQELITLMTTLYILQDSIFTASNVMGNGAFALIVERVCRFFFGGGNDSAKGKEEGYAMDEEDSREHTALKKAAV